MASAFPVQSPGPENLEESFSDIRKRINSKFDWLHKKIEDRRQFLLARLAELESTHNKESKQQQTGLSSVLRVQSQVMEELRENNVKHLQDSILDNIQIQIEQMKISLKLNNVYFEFDDDKARNFISSLGKVSKVPNYKAKKYPVIVSTAKHSHAYQVPGEFWAPTILSIEPNSGNIYIGCYNGLVHIFSPNAELIRAIEIKTSGYAVTGIAFNNEKIFIAFGISIIHQYHLNGTYVRKIPMPQRCVYAISLTILSNNLFIATHYGEYPIGVMDLDSMAIKPVNLQKIECDGSSVDMKSTPQGDLAILYSKTPFVVVYNVQGSMLAQPLRRSAHLESPEYFTIDSCGNFIISDSYIKIFQSNGDLLHTIGGTSNPELIKFALGVDIDSQGRIVSICGKQTNCLQIF